MFALIFGLLTIVACGPAPTNMQESSTDTEEMAEDTSDSGSEAMEEETVVEEVMEEEPIIETEGGVAGADSVAQPAIDGATTQEPSAELLALIPAYDDSDVQTTDSGLQYVIYEEGSGDVAVLGDTVVAHYTGYFPSGEVFDSSVDRGEPFQFPIGQGQVIRGWDEGFALFPPGTKALLIIPGDLAYGPGGRGNIPPNATLFFEVEMIEVKVAERPEEVADSDYSETPAGVKTFDIEEGTGEPPATGDVVGIHFTYWDGAGATLGNSRDGGSPLFFPIGTERMFVGLDEGVQGMKVGGQRQIVVPGPLTEGTGLPADTDYTFKVELISISPGPNETPTEISAGDFTTTETGVQYADIRIGDGEPLADGTNITVHYTVWTESGELIDSSYYTGAAIPYNFGEEAFPGWKEGMDGMAMGGIRQMIIPADVVANPNIPENVRIELEVLPAE